MGLPLDGLRGRRHSLLACANHKYYHARRFSHVVVLGLFFYFGASALLKHAATDIFYHSISLAAASGRYYYLASAATDIPARLFFFAPRQPGYKRPRGPSRAGFASPHTAPSSPFVVFETSFQIPPVREPSVPSGLATPHTTIPSTLPPSLLRPPFATCVTINRVCTEFSSPFASDDVWAHY